MVCDMKYAPLFQPLKIGRVTVKNRFALSPMAIGEVTAQWTDGPTAIDYYEERAKGGVGLIFTGAHFAENEVEKHGPAMPCILQNPAASKKTIAELARKVHAYGAKLFVQITIGLGRNGAPNADPNNNIAPSPCDNYWVPSVKHRAMTTEEIYKLIENYGKAAKLVKEAGADGIDVHSMHGGYLLDCFVMNAYNQRTDEFGGNLRGKANIAVKLRQEVAKTCGPDFPVSIRFGVKSFIRGRKKSCLPGYEFQEQGRDTEESLELVKILDEAGYDCFNVDCGSYDGDFWGKPPSYMPKGLYLPYSEQVKRVTNKPVLVSGRMGYPDVALDAVMSGKTDVVVMGRPLLADPDYVNKLKRGDKEDIRTCLGCNDGCLRRVGAGLQKAGCAINPRSNRERETELHPALRKRKILVVGGGPAGMEAARVAALRGHAVELVESSAQLGGKFRFASIPSFKSEGNGLISWYERQLEKTGVRVTKNYKLLKDDPKAKDADVIIVATGAKEIVPPLPGIEHADFAIPVLCGDVPVQNECTIVGGGLVGCELAIHLAMAGKKPRIVEMAPSLMPTNKPASQVVQAVNEYLERFEIETCVNTRLKEIKPGAIVVERDGAEEVLPTQQTILALGYRADTELYDPLYAQYGEVYNLGDSRQAKDIMQGIEDAYELSSHL